jgi:hypothetical protein
MSNQQHRKMDQHGRRVFRVTSLSGLSLLALACSGETVNLGEDVRTLDVSSSRCRGSSRIEGSVRASNQAQIDELAGCEVIDGNFYVNPFEAPDLRPLASLRVVGGTLDLGRFSLFDEATDDAQIEREGDLLASGWLASFEGLEGLESVGSIFLQGISAPSLAPLANLRGLTQGGRLFINICQNLTDLRGLENLRGVVDLQILCDSLESLQGLSLPTRMGDVTISGANLRDLGDLALEVVEDLDIRNTALENLDALSTLTTTDHLTLSSNPALTNLDGLNTLQESNGIRIIANPALERMPELDSLGYLRELALQQNERLVELPTLPYLARVFERSASQRDPQFDREYFRLDSLQIEDNAALERLQLPGAWALTGLIQISDNPSLQSIALAQVEAADHITIENNPALAQVDVGTLRTVDELYVLNNPLLPLTDFDGLRTFESELSSGPGSSAEP